MPRAEMTSSSAAPNRAPVHEDVGMAVGMVGWNGAPAVVSMAVGMGMWLQIEGMGLQV